MAGALGSDVERKVLEIARLEDIVESHVSRQAQQVGCALVPAPGATAGFGARRRRRTGPRLTSVVGGRHSRILANQIEHLYEEAIRYDGVAQLPHRRLVVRVCSW